MEPQTLPAPEVELHILRKIEQDPEFRARLIENPKQVIEDETGAILPDDALVIVEQRIADAQQQVASAETPLTEDELYQVMGGFACTTPDGEWYNGRCRDLPGPRG